MEWKTPAPLYRDPVFDGAADPVVIYNREEKEWWMFYTQRRASLPVIGVSGSFGCAIGIATSQDAGKTWIYRGTAQGLEIDWGHNTFWAPEVFYSETDQKYHMIVTYIRGVPKTWSEPKQGRNGMVHYMSENLWQWKFQNFIFDQENLDIIDACVYTLGAGNWRMWYRDTEKGCAIYAADTCDFMHFTQPVLAVPGHAEGPNVFSLGGIYWMVTDPLGERQGLAVYKSEDLRIWQKQPENILTQTGERPFDDRKGRHADVVTLGDSSYIFYFTQPYKDYKQQSGFEKIQDRQAICIVQCAHLRAEHGSLCCDRNEDFQISLSEEGTKNEKT